MYKPDWNWLTGDLMYPDDYDRFFCAFMRGMMGVVAGFLWVMVFGLTFYHDSNSIPFWVWGPMIIFPLTGVLFPLVARRISRYGNYSTYGSYGRGYYKTYSPVEWMRWYDSLSTNDKAMLPSNFAEFFKDPKAYDNYSVVAEELGTIRDKMESRDRMLKTANLRPAKDMLEEIARGKEHINLEIKTYKEFL